MREPITEEFAARWYAYWRRSSGSRNERKALELGEPAEVVAAHRLVSELVEQGAPDVVRILVALAETVPDGDDPLMVGVGPVEDLLYIHGDRFVGELVDQAGRSPEFAGALRHASLAEGTLSAAAGAKLDRFRAGR
jgi:hypothetical protein